MIDHTFLKPDGPADAIARLCDEAVEWRFRCVMVNPCNVAEAARRVAGTGVRVGTVIGFPLGQCTLPAMRAEAMDAIGNGARELDFVINVRALKAAASAGAGENPSAEPLTAGYRAMLAAIRAVRPGLTTKLIIETCYLADEEKTLACRVAQDAGFDFVKTSTGFGPAGATVADVALMRAAVGPDMGVKSAGGIRDLATALALVGAGANRLGCSAGVAIVKALNPDLV
jgi:deoxyribose-phosphate aldolase